MNVNHLRWHKANDKDKWIAYNKQRGQHASAMEHATPEQFWVDKKQCRYTDENGQVQNPSLNACAQAVSAVKAIQIAASQGQKVYTVNASNASAALAASGAGGEIKEAIQAGMEVTFHERGINAHGWSGTGYSIVDPETGVGSYLIEGKGNGGILIFTGLAIIGLAIYSLPELLFVFKAEAVVVYTHIAMLSAGLMLAGWSVINGDVVGCGIGMSMVGRALQNLVAPPGVGSLVKNLLPYFYTVEFSVFITAQMCSNIGKKN